MKAMLMTAVNQPLSLRNIPDPQPGPGQVRIRLHATGVCGTDIHIWHGELPVPLPIVPGHEPVGTIDAVGPGPHPSSPAIASAFPGFRTVVEGVLPAKRKDSSFARSPKLGLPTAAAMLTT